MKIRKGNKDDLPEILELIKELAHYENALDEVQITLEQLEEDGFGIRPWYWFLVAEENETIIGMAFYHIRYSTWKGKFLFLEDFVIREKYRRKGLGSALFQATVNIAIDEKLNGMTWQVLDWNIPAINFYKKYQADISGDWLNGKLSKSQLIELYSKVN
tara:strand:+ start:686 stop:1162 length:477 start_codon:yes stop_codon:yes gene_type:complete